MHKFIEYNAKTKKEHIKEREYTKAELVEQADLKAREAQIDERLEFEQEKQKERDSEFKDWKKKKKEKNK